MVTNNHGLTVTGKLSGQTTKKVSASPKRHLKLTAKSLTVAARAEKTLKLKLPKALGRLLKRKHKLSLRLTANLKDPARAQPQRQEDGLAETEKAQA